MTANYFTITDKQLEIIARIAHVNNMVHCRNIGDVFTDWYDTSDSFKRGVILGVEATAKKVINDGDILPSESHEMWLKYKKEEGWVYGVVKDEKLKTHPCIKPYDELPEAQKMKDKIFIDTVKKHSSVYVA